MRALRQFSSNFSEPSDAEWRRLANRGAEGDPGRLTSVTMDGLPLGPLYARANGPVLPMRRPGSPWTRVQRIDRGNADFVREAITAAMRGGAGGIELVFSSASATHSRGIIDPKMEPDDLLVERPSMVRIDAGEISAQIATRFASLGCTVVSVYDPWAHAALRGQPAPMPEESVSGIAALIAVLEGIERDGLAFVADGRPWHAGGASEAQELAVTLASAVASLRLLDAAGVAPARSWRRLGAALGADADQFLTIAKFRALRLLFARLAEILEVGSERSPIHAETAWRMLARRDPTMNMIRATTAAFAAGVGGADSITVLPPLFEDRSFGDRMARNTQSILLEESSLSREDDPGAGAGAVEALTGELARTAWDLFARIEGEGGLAAALGSGSILRAVAETRDSRLAKVARREIALVGVNAYVDRRAPIPPNEPANRERRPEPIDALWPIRLAEPFERLFARSRDPSGRRVAVLLVNSGRGEDAAASADAFASGGFEVVSARESFPNAPLSEAAARSGASLACITVGANGWEPAIEAALQLRAAGTRFIAAAAGSAEGFPAAPGFDAVLTPATDVVSFLEDVLDRIAQPEENGQS